MILLRLEEKQYVIFRSLDHLREMFEPLTITTKKILNQIKLINCNLDIGPKI